MKLSISSPVIMMTFNPANLIGEVSMVKAIQMCRPILPELRLTVKFDGKGVQAHDYNDHNAYPHSYVDWSIPVIDNQSCCSYLETHVSILGLNSVSDCGVPRRARESRESTNIAIPLQTPSSLKHISTRTWPYWNPLWEGKPRLR